jgi:hypothetical protein
VTFFADFTSGQSNVSYTRMRQLLATSGGGLQEGVIGAGDLKVSQRALGANPSVDVAVGDAWVQYDTGTRNGLSHVWSDAVANVAINASDVTNPRIDQIGVQLNDVGVGAGTGGNTPALRYVPGTATPGTTSFIQGTFFMDGAAIDSTGAIAAYPFVTGQTGASLGLQWDYVAVPPAGSHLFSPAWVTGSATATLLATAGNPLVLTIEEIVRPNASNT